MLKRQAVVDQIEVIAGRLKAWDETPRETAQVLEVPLDVIEGIRELAAMTHTMDVQESAFELVMAIDDFVIETEIWLNKRAITKDSSEPNGSDAMWTRWVNVLAHKSQKRAKKLPPVTFQMDRGVGEAQICRKYGILDENGDPDRAGLAEHLMCERRGEMKSKYYDPDTFVAPAVKRRLASIREVWERREDKLGRFGVSLTGRNTMPRGGKKKESRPIEVLASMRGMSEDQIARMHNISVSEVRDYLAGHNYFYDAAQERYIAWENGTALPGNMSRQMGDEDMLEGRDSHDELGDDIEARVAAIRDDGNGPAMVSKILSYHRVKENKPKVTYQQVTAMLSKIDAIAKEQDSPEPEGDAVPKGGRRAKETAGSK